MTKKTTLDEFQNESHESNEESNERDTQQTTVEEIQCNCHVEERNSKGWQDLKEEYQLYDPGCGHAISYLIKEIGATIGGGTPRNYSSRLRLFTEFLHWKGTNFCEMGIGEVDQFMSRLARRNYSESTLVTYRAIICNVVKHISLFRDEECNTSRAMIIESVNPSNYRTGKEFRREPLSRKEAEKLLAELDTFRDMLITQFGIELGPRSIDLRTVKLKDVKLEDRVIELKNTKTQNNYTLPIGSELALRLRHWINTERSEIPGAKDNPYLFPAKEGSHLSGSQLNQIIKSAASDAGIQEIIGTAPLTERQQEMMGGNKTERQFRRVTVHTLRHTFSDLLDEAGMSLQDRSSALTHSSIEVTREHYNDQDEEYKELLREFFSEHSISS